MPMIPSSLAALELAALDVGGYSVFALGLNRIVGRRASPFSFAASRTAFGLVAGLAYLLVASAFPPNPDLFVRALWLRGVICMVSLKLFYGLHDKPWTLLFANLVGIAWSYGLDELMSFLNGMPSGIILPFC
jgi:hypothetical protein